jgi:arginyl-tRNA synthetase
MEIDEFIRSTISEAFAGLYSATVDPAAVKLESTNPDFKGDITFVTFPYLKVSKKSPEQTANDIGAFLKEKIQQIREFNVVKGFLNLEFTETYWLDRLKFHQISILKKNAGRVMVEYSSPNTNKPLHLGHIRNNLLGYSVAEILKYSGYDVTRVNLVNDRGIHICKSMLAWKKWGNGETPASSGMKGDHLVGKYYVEFDKHYKEDVNRLVEGGMDKAKAEKEAPLMLEVQDMLRQWEAGDEAVLALWKMMNDWVFAGFAQTYQQLGVEFEQTYLESNTYLLGKDIVEEGLQKGVFFQKPDGSVWIDLTADGLDEKLVRRSDGTSVYMTQDLGTAEMKYNDFQCEKSIYVVGNEQDYHFKVLFLILKKLGRKWADGCYHLSYGMVDLPSGKMKSREGTVVDADELMQEMIDTARAKTEELGKTEGMTDKEKQHLYQMLGLGALKFFMLKVDPQKRMLFDPAESIDLQGDTGPFVQYTYARISSILRTAEQAELNAEYEVDTAKESELNLIRVLCDFEKEVLKAAALYSPSVIAAYVLQVAKAFNRVYNDVSFLKEADIEKRKFRLQLAQKTQHSIHMLLDMLGMECPERM